MRGTHHFTIGLLTAGLLLAVLPAMAEPATLSPQARTATAIVQATGALQAGDCAQALPPLAILWDDEALQASDPDLAAQMRIQRIACTANTAGIPAALALSTANLKRADANITAYDMQIFLQLMSGQTPAAADTLDVALTRLPAQAPALTDISVIGVLLSLHDTQNARVLGLLDHLEDAHWQIHLLPGRPLMGRLRIEGLRHAVAAGDAAHAALYRADIAQDALTYVLSEGDATLSDPGVAAQPMGPVIAGEIADIQRVVANNPTDLQGLNYLIQLERINDQSALALTQLNGILALIDQYGLDKFNAPDTYADLLTQKAELLADLGQGDKARAAYEDGIKKLGDAATPLRLSYMNYLIDSGDEQAGLAQGAAITLPADPQPQAAIRTVLTADQACAYGYLHDQSNYAKGLAALAGTPMLAIKPQLCAGDSAAAAMSLIGAISSPASRDAAIMYLQKGLPPIPFGERDRLFITAQTALKTRPDVQAAAKAAHITVRDWPLRF